ncbi:MAG: AAA family ATPase [Acidobacteria bacterium]|nr:AAA family ATPase [Acidobacteriota bacterium]
MLRKPLLTGKTTMALALAKAIKAELVHVPSQKCTAAMVDGLRQRCAYIPMFATWRIVLVDEADRMTENAQLALLSLLDATDAPAKTIWIFTCNDTEGLEKRFLSRCIQIPFSSYGLNGAGSSFLQGVWEAEKGAMRQPSLIDPDFARILKNSGNNLRDALSGKANLVLVHSG